MQPPSPSEFITRWSQASGAERANYQLLLTELCETLAPPRPEPASSDTAENAYVFERKVIFPHASLGYIDLYKRGCFVLEAKQTGKELGSGTWGNAMLRAHGQAQQYARALPAVEGPRLSSSSPTSDAPSSSTPSSAARARPTSRSPIRARTASRLKTSRAKSPSKFSAAFGPTRSTSRPPAVPLASPRPSPPISPSSLRVEASAKGGSRQWRIRYPMFEAHPLIETPPDDTIVWRYLNLEKLLALLNSRTLYCRRLDRFRDPWEGVWPDEFALALRKSDSGDRSRGLSQHFDDLRRTFFVNCWHESEFESAALWDQYASSSGLAIRSTVRRIKVACETEQQFFLGRIKYFDYSSHITDAIELNAVVPAFLKRKSFEHEHEVRLLIWDTLNFEPNEDGTRTEESCSLAVNLENLIEVVYVSPESPSWLPAHLCSLLGRFDLPNVSVKCSSLYDVRVL